MRLLRSTVGSLLCLFSAFHSPIYILLFQQCSLLLLQLLGGSVGILGVKVLRCSFLLLGMNVLRSRDLLLLLLMLLLLLCCDNFLHLNN